MRWLVLRAIVLLLAGAISTPAFADPILNPADFTSLGTANISGVTAANTDTLTLGGFTGVLDQGFAVFDFSDFTMTASADLTVTGSRGLAILSRNNIDILGGTLDASAISQLDLVAANEVNISPDSILLVRSIEIGSGLGLSVDGGGAVPVSGITLPDSPAPSLGTVVTDPPPPPVVIVADGSPPPPIIILAAVPEPPSMLLLAASLVLLWSVRRARPRQQQ